MREMRRVLVAGLIMILTACAPHGTSAVGQEVAPAPSGKATPAPSLEPAAIPVWKLGDEWSFQYEDATSKGTFVDVVTRDETVDGIECYVVRSGGSEFYYRKTDMAYYIQKDSSGKIIRRHVPPHAFMAWPMAVGKQWQESLTLERPQTRETEALRVTMRIEATETVTVPAGTFDTFKIVRRNDRTGAVDGEFWYSPQVRYFVRFRIGNYLRELTKFTVPP
jgi:hypothetical protein